MEYMEYDDFRPSITALYRQGGPFKNAAEKVFAIRQKAFSGFEHKDVFAIATTHNGESRIPHCVKYELPGRARLVTMANNGICMFLYAGDHTEVDRWLDRNRSIDFILKRQGNAQVIEPVFVSQSTNRQDLIKTESDLGAPDHLLDLISGRYGDKLLDGLPEETARVIASVGPLITDDELLQIVESIKDQGRRSAVLDVLLKLRESDANGAKNRIDLYFGEVKQLADLTEDEATQLQSGERVIKVTDVDPQLFEHFVKTASYQKWMLYLHPSQREYVDREHSGSMRLSGISGSGKTCVLIHRALRLAEKYPDGRILILTLNAALAKLIDSLVSASRGALRPKNIRVSSFWELCREKLLEIEPQNKKLYTQVTVATNPYAVSEHIDEIWNEYYNCENNNHDADQMERLHRSLLARRIFPKDYLKQEFDYVRSAFAPSDREQYFEMERTGRAIPLDRPFRKQVFDGLAGWERKMLAVGAIDATAIATALHKHQTELKPEYRCVLVDEVQDFGTLELTIIRRLVADAENDLFLCGDAAQSVHTKHQDFEASGINVRGGKSTRLQQNYRNSRQILTAAHDILIRNYQRHSAGLVDLEILPPEYANFSSSNPNLLQADSMADELGYAIAYARNVVETSSHKKVCIALAGYHQRSVDALGIQLGLPVLNGDINIGEGQVFLADLEQTKGFEFDSMIIINAHAGVLPHPDLPVEESFRDLSKFYVAMTRAKTELIVSYHGSVTDFIGSNQEHFSVGDWKDYAEKLPIAESDLPAAGVPEKKFGVEWDLTGKQFLRLPEAIGLPQNAQEKLIECVTGKMSFEGKKKKQKTWKSIGEFLNDMQRPMNRTPVSLSDEAWAAIASHFGRPSGVIANTGDEKI